MREISRLTRLLSVFCDISLINLIDINISKISEEIVELDNTQLNNVSVQSVIELEDLEFEIEVNESAALENDVDYKWGYKLKLHDLNFMAKIDVTSGENIVVIDNQTLKIGENYLSFADLLEQGNVIGWFQGRMEWGPRALGSRSILADPRSKKMKDIVNA